MDLFFRVPHSEKTRALFELLLEGLPNLTKRRAIHFIQNGNVSTNGRPNQNPDAPIRPDTLVEVNDIDVDSEESSNANAEMLARGEDWVVINKPVGMPGSMPDDDPLHPLLFVADELGIDRETFTPVWPFSASVGGPMLFSFTPDAAEALRARWLDGDMMLTLRVLVPDPEQSQGVFDGDDIHLQYSTVQRDEGLSELQLIPEWRGDKPDQNFNLLESVCGVLADSEYPVLSDLERGGYLAGSRKRICLESINETESDLAHSWSPEDWWPGERVVPPVEPKESALEDIPTFAISKVAMAKLEDGHPWVEFGDARDSLKHLDPGTLVQFCDRDNNIGPFGLIDGASKAAYLWSQHKEDVSHFDREVEHRVDGAISRRSEFLTSVDEIDLFRMVHGEADGLAGLYIDRMGPLVRSLIANRGSEAFRNRVYNNLWRFDPNTSILEFELDEDGIRRGRRLERGESKPPFEPVKNLQSDTNFSPVLTRENGLKFWADPLRPMLMWAHYQRPLRQWIRDNVTQNEKWLNLGNVTSPDIVLRDVGAEVAHIMADRRARLWLEETIELNQLDGEIGDQESKLDDLEGDFGGAIIDLTDLGEAQNEKDLVSQLIDEIIPNGKLIMCRYDRSKDKFETLLEESERTYTISRLSPPVDLPHSAGMESSVTDIIEFG